MSLMGALNLGSSALSVQQAALQVTGNNIANAGNADYTRQVANVTSNPDEITSSGQLIGTGISLTSVQRQINDALEARIRSSTSDNSASTANQQWLSQIEGTFNALGSTNISSAMSTFFNDWSNLANQPQDVAQRQVVIQDGISLTQQFNDTSTQLTSIESQIDAQINSDAQNANNLAQKIADLNGQIVVSQGSGDGHPNDLMDQRDADLKQLSQLLNVNTVHQENGAINVYVGSEPLVIGTQNQGIAVQTTTVNGKAVPSLVFKSNNGPVPATSGELGGLLGTRAQADSIITQTNTLAGNLIFELNKLHASGQGTSPITSATATNGVSDVNAALNTAGAGLKFQPVNGSFVVHVQNASGQETSTLVKVDLDGLNNNDTTLTSLAASLNAITGVSATITGGKLTVAAANGASGISFSQDSSGVVAALGINTFFSGNDASNIAVNLALQTQPGLLAAAQNGDAADNTNALAIASLGSTPIASMNGSSLDDSYQSIVNGIATQVSDAKTNTQASSAVLSALSAQHDSTSGVSLDEEAVNLMQQQRAFQGAARLITTIDQMMQTLINM